MIEDYLQHLCYALKHPPRCGSNLNVMMYVMGSFSDRLSKEKKSFFLDSLQKYRNGSLPLRVNTSILRLWLKKFEEDYLLKQTFLNLIPEN